MSARTIDTNGWFEIKGNPISKAGVFQYLGSELPSGLGLNPGKMYNIYRSKKELEKKEAMDSFKLLPWTDGHPEKLLGSPKNGLVSAIDKGVHGVTGQEIYMDGDILKSNLKTFSENLADQISSGKKDLSLGYKADYILENGVYNGEDYQLVQVNLLGNHISIVDEGRTGREVSVLDEKQKEVQDMKEGKEEDTRDEEKEESTITLGMIATQMKELKEYVMEAYSKLMNTEGDEDGSSYDEKGKEDDAENKDTKDEDNESKKDEDKKETKDEDKGKDKDKDDYKKGSMDAAALKKSVFEEISQRDKLSGKLSKHIGVFDSAEMTLDEVARYGVKKLGLSCAKGQENVLIDGYLAGKLSSPVVRTSAAMDNSINSIKSSQIEAYLKGEK